MTILIPGASLNPWLPGLYFPAKKNCTNTANAAFSRAMVILHLFLVPNCTSYSLSPVHTFVQPLCEGSRR